MSRKRIWAIGLTAATALTGVAAAQNSFTIIALPDTQNYVNSSSNAPLFTQQTQWIADQILLNGNPFNIQFVSHLGDVVSSGSSLTQWSRADASMSVLETGGPDGVVPYGVLPGNHDYASTGNKSTGTDNYVANFGPSRFAGASWYGGADPSGNNSYQLFTGGGQPFLHIALEWRPTENVTNGPTRDPSPIEWAQSIISANPGVPTIVSTHENLDDDPPGRSAAGQAMWNELIRKNDQIITVLNGHYHSVGGFNDGEYHQVSQNDFGKDVVESLQDYQDYPNGGDGWLRIITFDFDADEIRFQTYSPVLDQFQTETVGDVGQYASQFTIAMDFDTRFQFEDPPQPPAPIFEEVAFQQGVDSYAGTQDKEVRSSGGDSANGDNTEISVDGDDGSPGAQPNHALVRFDGVIGTRGVIDPGTVIDSATLSLNVINPGSGFDVHQMIADWDESTTWADLGGDGVTPGVEAKPSPLTSVGADNGIENVPTGNLDLDVTAAVEAWLAGEANYGVGLVALPNGTNGIDFTTSESATPPVLTIRRLLPGLGLRDYAEGVDGYAGAVDTQIREADPNTSYGSATSFSLDASDGGAANHVLIRFENLLGTGVDQVPTDRPIVRAWLTVTAFNPGDGGSVHRMLQPWSPTDTWAGAFGGDGVQADDVEAVASPDAFVVGSTGKVEIDVTASLAAWRTDPATNLGWVFLPTGNNGWDFSSSEASEGDRPVLTVVFDTAAPCVGDLSADDQVDTDDLFALLGAWGPCPGCDADLTDDDQVNTDDLFALLGVWGACP